MHAFADKNADYFVADPEVVGKALSEAPTDLDHYTPESLVAFTATKKEALGGRSKHTRAEAKTLIDHLKAAQDALGNGLLESYAKKKFDKRSGRKNSPRRRHLDRCDRKYLLTGSVETDRR